MATTNTKSPEANRADAIERFKQMLPRNVSLVSALHDDFTSVFEQRTGDSRWDALIEAASSLSVDLLLFLDRAKELREN